MTVIVDESPTDDFLQEFRAVAIQDRQLALASWAFELVDILLGAKADTNTTLVREIHPELGDVGEEAVYVSLRKVILGALRQSERPDLLGHATRLLPDRLFPVIKGWMVWDRDEAEDLRSKLDAACTEAGLDRYRDIPAWFLSAECEKVLFIAEETRLKQAAQLPVPLGPDENAPSTLVSFDEYLAQGLAEASMQFERDWPLPPPTRPPLPVGSGFDAPDQQRSSDSKPWSPVRPAKEIQARRRKPRVVFDRSFVQGLYWYMHDNPPRGEKERCPSAVEVRDRLVELGWRHMSDRKMREYMREDKRVGWPPPRPPAEAINEGFLSEYSKVKL